jgi:RNA polymerase sigma-70 factor (ECF subfamily)
MPVHSLNRVDALVTNSDWDDIRAALSGDEEAYGRLVKRYEPNIAAQVWRLCRDKATCEELVQEVFVEAYFNLSGYRGEAPFLQWLRRIATRVGSRFCRKAAREPRHVPIEEWDQAGQQPETLDPARAAAMLHALLARLAPDDRLLLTMIYFEGCSTREVVDRTGWNEGAVKMRASRARDKLRKIMEAENFTEV